MPGVAGVSTAQFKEWLMWATYVATWAAGIGFAASIFFVTNWLTMIAAGVLFAVTFAMAHHTHEMHLSERLPPIDRLGRGHPGEDWEVDSE